MKRPSMLFIRAGQLTASALAAYGHRQVLTPNLHRIAARSTVFHNACSPSRNCTSSRFAMMSGQRSWRTRAFGNVAELPASVPTIAH